MTRSRRLKWIAAALLAPLVLLGLVIALFDWNWLKGPIERKTLATTGRVLVINGNLSVKYAWPAPRLLARSVTFANPDWTREKQMLSADAVEIAIDLPQLLRRNIVLTEVRLERPVVFLEQGSGGRKNWLLDVNQQDENARIRIDRLSLDAGKLGYDDAAARTSIRAELATVSQAAGANPGPGLTYSALGQFKGQSLKLRGEGGPVLAIRDVSTPYPMSLEGSVGSTGVRAKGTITSLLKFTAMDMQLALNGANLAQLYTVLGIAFPDTRPYTTQGHLIHAGTNWHYEKFTGRFGASDLGGDLRVDTGGKRPLLKAELVSRVLDLDDLGPMIGARPGSVTKAVATAVPAPAPGGTGAAVAAAPAGGKVLPDLPFDTVRWNSVDADVQFKAGTIRRAQALPLENLNTHLSLHDSLLKLDPLDFGVAGGHLASVITLDGNRNPIQAHAQVRARKLQMSKMFPTFKLNQASIGQVNGDFDLAGHGNSVGRMLASADGKAALVVSGGEVSRLMMEEVGLHLWEILQLKISGDQSIKLRCAVAEFEVKGGVMRTNALVFDTQVTTVMGTGSVDLGRETLDLTIRQRTKNTSPLSLRSPIYIRGTFAHPDVAVDKGQVALRALGAAALGFANPLLILIPLIDLGPGKDSDCGQLVRDARAQPRPDHSTPKAP